MNKQFNYHLESRMKNSDSVDQRADWTFSFSHNVFKSCLFLMRQTKYLWSKGLITR